MEKTSRHHSSGSHARLFWILCVFCLFLFASIASQVTDTEAVDNETCTDCHDGLAAVLNKSAHPASSTGASRGMEVLCVSCHSGGATHIEDPTTENIGNPSKLTAAQNEQVCIQCHQPHIGMGIAAFDVHADQDVSCTDCHGIHAVKQIPAAEEMCGTCHTAIATDFLKRSHHPLREQNISCISCHDFSGQAEPNFGHGAAAACYTCHPQQSGPYLFEHQATNSFTVDGDGCVSCHAPHASTNDRLLKQPDDKLCLQCHAAPPGHQNAHNGELTGYACVDCHSQIHGSYDNLYFLDPQLGSKVGGGPDGCYCHYYR